MNQNEYLCQLARGVGKQRLLYREYAAKSWKIDYEELQRLLTVKSKAPAPEDICHTRGEREAYTQAVLACKSILSNYNKYHANNMRG